MTGTTSTKTPETPPPAEKPIEIPKDAIPIVPLRDAVLFPGAFTPIAVGRPSSALAIDAAVKQDREVGFILQRDPSVDEPGPDQLHEVGTAAGVMKLVALPQGARQIVVHGRRRFKVVEFVRREPFPVARVEVVTPAVPDTQEFQARVLYLRELALRGVELLPRPMPELAEAIAKVDNPGLLADILASSMDIPLPEKQDLLETFDLDARIQKVTAKVQKQVEILELARKISSETEGRLDKMRREALLREQMKTIQRELGEEDARRAEIERLRERILAAGMPPDVEKEALKELSRLERMPEAASEYTVVRTYLDWLLELPWKTASEEEIDIKRAREILERDHHGLEKVKKRILEFLAVRKLNPGGKSPILCFVGPPGTGKTSLGQSIARAMGRKFVRQSLGGVHDEAEIRGHRRTYVGALPGRIIQGIRKAGTRNPVFMLDEIDKLSASFHGDPSAALLEVLDPEQNHSFEDHYLGVPFDLRQVLFIATANVIDNVPGPLRDRMEVLELPGYTEEEKVEIARRYLLPRQLETNGLDAGALTIEEGALREMIASYTREAGVRQIEREIGTICRAIATRVAAGDRTPVTVRAEDLRRYLGPPRFFNEVALRTSLPGVATGLAWTPTGGEVLFVEATKMPGEGKLILTGQLGDVMKESAQAALSLLRSRVARYGIASDAFKENDIHIHVPAGAIPKDGPSAGVTMFVALASLMLGRCVRHDVAMTGEVSLRGLVLPIGGVKEKVLAARRAGVKRVLLPEQNRKDLEELPPSVRETIEFTFLKTVDDALEHAIERECATIAPGATQG